MKSSNYVRPTSVAKDILMKNYNKLGDYIRGKHGNNCSVLQGHSRRHTAIQRPAERFLVLGDNKGTVINTALLTARCPVSRCSIRWIQ